MVFTGANDGPPGTVAVQDPAGGSSGAGEVRIEIYGSDITVIVPNVTGRTVGAAQAALAAAGLGCAAGTAGPDASIVSQSPRAGTAVRLGALITVTVSTGPAPSGSP